MNVLAILALLSVMSPTPQESGIYQATLERPDADSLRYTISIPPGYETGKPRPLVVALHYSGTVTPYFGAGILTELVEPGLRELGAIIVAPDCPRRSWANSESETAVIALVDHIREAFSVDERRILVTGYSMGGTGTWYMASRHPELFSVAIPIAGSPPGGSVDQVRHIAIYAIHGSRDTVVRIGRTQRAFKTLKQRQLSVELVVLNGATHYEVPRFTEPLREAVPWIRKVWGE